MKNNPLVLVLTTVLACGLLTAGCSKSADKAPPESAQTPATQAAPAETMPAMSAVDAEHLPQAVAMVNKGVAALMSARDSDGAWSMGPNNAAKPALTALVLKAVLQSPEYTADSPDVKKALDVLLSYQQGDGGIYDPKQGFESYGTATAVSALALVRKDDPRYEQALQKAVKYLRGVQITAGDKAPDGTIIEDSDPEIGGVGYGTSGSPNLSVLNLWIDAMKDAGVEADDPAMKEAVTFLTALQNRSESNTPLPDAPSRPDDGGFPYDLKHSKADADAMRSYGTMTYAGFKSLLYAGVSRDDGRVRAAYDWIRRFWRLDSNPNMPYKQSQQGLYYYYHVFAKALRAWGQPVIADSKGVEHNWRHELIDALAARQRADGSWVNTEPRWMESSPVLATAYCVLALQEALEP